VIAGNDTSAIAYYCRGTAYLHSGDRVRAVADLTAAIELDSNMVEAYFKRGEAFLEQQLTDSAFHDYSRAARNQPSYARAYWGLGNTLFMRDKEMSLKYYDKAIAVDSTQAMFYAARGVLLCAMKNYQRAIADQTTAMKLGGEIYGDYHYNRAVAYLFSGDTATAVKDMEMSKKLGNKEALEAIKTLRKMK
jgi:tetratricopeptide (TPR) repeat protein